MLKLEFRFDCNSFRKRKEFLSKREEKKVAAASSDRCLQNKTEEPNQKKDEPKKLDKKKLDTISGLVSFLVGIWFASSKFAIRFAATESVDDLPFFWGSR